MLKTFAERHGASDGPLIGTLFEDNSNSNSMLSSLPFSWCTPYKCNAPEDRPRLGNEERVEQYQELNAHKVIAEYTYWADNSLSGTLRKWHSRVKSAAPVGRAASEILPSHIARSPEPLEELIRTNNYHAAQRPLPSWPAMPSQSSGYAIPEGVQFEGLKGVPAPFGSMNPSYAVAIRPVLPHRLLSFNGRRLPHKPSTSFTWTKIKINNGKRIGDGSVSPQAIFGHRRPRCYTGSCPVAREETPNTGQVLNDRPICRVEPRLTSRQLRRTDYRPGGPLSGVRPKTQPANKGQAVQVCKCGIRPWADDARSRSVADRTSQVPSVVNRRQLPYEGISSKDDGQRVQTNFRDPSGTGEAQKSIRGWHV
ncbi:hypothetical protein SODALDRAFT_363685 [Sodiomyces alkalinus F11]|uniref:Uncharacterized protein n=1 Tax=Sodiomyces alkalinus (strain CBS 110278 / VKM F-3762 / F11) TaxID=1314773 RepID=A0A3N2PKD0_SODAK|nr:hypothetical protein SODALDRAFT_363685 [Sodiomyces alkalinus F11]ROT34988.1 hypothetical protein SODALDRAFT_363685 [Sodiomyces alkalinus F11]